MEHILGYDDQEYINMHKSLFERLAENEREYEDNNYHKEEDKCLHCTN